MPYQGDIFPYPLISASNFENYFNWIVARDGDIYPISANQALRVPLNQGRIEIGASYHPLTLYEQRLWSARDTIGVRVSLARTSLELNGIELDVADYSESCIWMSGELVNKRYVTNTDGGYLDHEARDSAIARVAGTFNLVRLHDQAITLQVTDSHRVY